MAATVPATGELNAASFSPAVLLRKPQKHPGVRLIVVIDLHREEERFPQRGVQVSEETPRALQQPSKEENFDPVTKSSEGENKRDERAYIGGEWRASDGGRSGIDDIGRNVVATVQGAEDSLGSFVEHEECSGLARWKVVGVGGSLEAAPVMVFDGAWREFRSRFVTHPPRVTSQLRGR